MVLVDPRSKSLGRNSRQLCPLPQSSRDTVERDSSGSFRCTNSLLKRLRERSLNRPLVVVNPVHQHSSADSDTPSPLSARQRFTVERQVSVGSSVADLLFSTSPTNVFRFVAFRVINTIKRVVFARSTSNVLEEFSERVLPPLADGDASPPVIFVEPAVGIKTSVLHRTPGGVLRSSRHPGANVFELTHTHHPEGIKYYR